MRSNGVSGVGQAQSSSRDEQMAEDGGQTGKYSNWVNTSIDQ